MIAEYLPHEPHIHKTNERFPLLTFVYQLLADGTPISYGRIYKRSWEHIQLIMKKVNAFYSYSGDGAGGQYRMHFRRLADETGIRHHTLMLLLLKMATCKQVISYDGQKYKSKILRKKPFILLQQRRKAIERSRWGKKTPLYILPFEKFYFTPRKTKEVADVE